MKDITKDRLIDAVFSAFPNANQIRDFDTITEPTAIRFTWRGNKFRVDTSGFTESVGNGVLISDDIASLAGVLIKKELYFILAKN
jgi:hypothetical protein